MEVSSSPGAARFIEAHGGRLYAWKTYGTFRLSANEPPGRKTFVPYDAGGFTLFAEQRSVQSEGLLSCAIRLHRLPVRHISADLTLRDPDGQTFTVDASSVTPRQQRMLDRLSAPVGLLLRPFAIAFMVAYMALYVLAWIVCRGVDLTACLFDRRPSLATRLDQRFFKGVL